MKKVIISAILLTAASYTMISCTASRSATGPAGAVTAYGSASNISAGRNAEGGNSPGSNSTAGPGIAGNNPAGAKDSLSKKVDAAANKTAQFILQASQTSYVQVESSKIALQNSQNSYVKTFAALLISDHAKADADLKSLAAAKNISLDSAAKNKDSDEKVRQLSAVKGEELESLYIQMMIKDHEQAVSLFEEGEGAADPQVKAYAKQYLPMLKSHLKIVSSLHK
jgi:putative membrane protein